MTNPAPLSPAAQAVWDAFNKDLRWLDDLDERNVAAALRAAALYCKQDRLILLSLADELDAYSLAELHESHGQA